LHFVHNFA
jgi:hypothetical protein